MHRRILCIVMFVLVLLSVQVALPNDTEHHSVTADLLEEVQALRDILDAFLSPRKIDGTWRFNRGNPKQATGATVATNSTCSGVDTWFNDMLSGNATGITLTQYGNFLIGVDTTGTIYQGNIRGDYFQFQSTGGPLVSEGGLVITGRYISLGYPAYTVPVTVQGMSWGLGPTDTAECTGTLSLVGGESTHSPISITPCNLSPTEENPDPCGLTRVLTSRE